MKKILFGLIIIILGLSFSSANLQKGASYGFFCEYNGDNMLDFYSEISQQRTYCGFIEDQGTMYNFYMHMINDNNLQVKFIDQVQNQLVEYQYFKSGSDTVVRTRYSDFNNTFNTILERGDMKVQTIAGTGDYTVEWVDSGGWGSVEDNRAQALYSNFNLYDGLGYYQSSLDVNDVLFAGQNQVGNVEIGEVLYNYKNNNQNFFSLIAYDDINAQTTHPYYSLSGYDGSSVYTDLVDAERNIFSSVGNWSSSASGYYYNNQFHQTLIYTGDDTIKTNNMLIKYDGDYKCSLKGYNKDGNYFKTYYEDSNCSYVNESDLLNYNQDNLYTQTSSTDLAGNTCKNINIQPADGLILTNTGDLQVNNNVITLNTTGYNNILSGINISFNSALKFDNTLSNYDYIMTQEKIYIKTFSQRSLNYYTTLRDGLSLKNPGVNQRTVEVWNTNTDNKVSYGMTCTNNGFYDINANGNNLITEKGIDYGYSQTIESVTGAYPENFTVEFFKIQYYKIQNSNLLILGKMIGNTSTSDLNTRKEIELQKEDQEVGEAQAGNVFDDIFSCDRNEDGNISITYELPVCPITVGSNATTIVVSGINNISQTMSLLGDLGNVNQQQMSNTTGTFSNVTIAGMSGHSDGLGRFVIIIKWLAYAILFIVLIIYIFS